MLASQKPKGCQWPGGGWQEGLQLPDTHTCALGLTEIRTGLCWRGRSRAAPHTQMWADVGMLRVETPRLFLFDGVGLINGGGDNANSTSQVDCWQESWCLNTFCKIFMEVFENRVSPHVSGFSGRSFHKVGCGFDEASKSFQHSDSVVKIRQAHVATKDREWGSNGKFYVLSL